MKKRNSFILGALVIGIAITSPAMAGKSTVYIGGGGAKGQYIKIAQAACKALGPLFTCKAVETGGSGDNMERVANSDLDFGLVMGAVEQKTRDEQPGYSGSTQLVRFIAYEALFAYGKEDVIDQGFINWEGVKANAFAANFAVPSEKSGDYLTFKDLPGLEDAMLSNYSTRDAQVTAVITEEANIGFAAQFPNPKNAFFKMLKKNKLKVMPVLDTDLAVSSELYRVQTVPVASNWLGNNAEIQTMVVPVAFIAKNPEAYADPKRQKLQKALIKRFKKIQEAKMLPQEGFFAKMIGNKIAMGASDLKKMGEELKEKAKAAAMAKLN